MVYIMAILILPFGFLGGFHGIFQFLKNQQELHQIVTSTEASIISVLRLVFRNGDPEWIKALTTVFSIVFMILCLFSLFALQETWKRVALLIAIMVMIPQWSGIYTLIYFFVPLVLFVAAMIADPKGVKPCKIYYGTIFAFIISLVLTGRTWHEMPWGKLIPLFSAYLLASSLIEGFYSGLKKARSLT